MNNYNCGSDSVADILFMKIIRHVEKVSKNE